MNLLYHRSDTQYHLLRKILGTLQGQNDAGGANSSLNVTATGVSKVVTPNLGSFALGNLSVGDFVTGSFEIPGAFREAGKHTILHSAVLIDSGSTFSDCSLILSSVAIAGAASGEAANLDSEVNNIFGVLTFDDYLDNAGVNVCSIRSIGLVLPPPPSGTSLWGTLVAAASFDLGAYQVALKLGFLQD